MNISLKDECKKVGFTVAQLSEHLDVPERTLQGWVKSRPVMMQRIFQGLQAKKWFIDAMGIAEMNQCPVCGCYVDMDHQCPVCGCEN